MKSRRKNQAKPESEQAKRNGGSWGNEFLLTRQYHAEDRSGWEAAAHSALVEGLSRKFFYLKGKIKKGKSTPKNERKNFLFCSPQDGRRCWAGSAPIRAQIVAQNKFEHCSVIATKSDFRQFEEGLFARLASLTKVAFGRGGRIRTCDLQVPNLARWTGLRYTPMQTCLPAGRKQQAKIRFRIK